VSASLPPDGTDFSSDFAIEGQPDVKDQPPPIAYFIRVSPDYFAALGIPLRSGRIFTAADSPTAPPVVLINETLERRFFPLSDAVGRRMNLGSAQEPYWSQIVGVVGDVKYNGLAEEVQPALYQPVAQQPAWGMSLVVKTDVADPLNLAAAVRQEVRKLDPELPIAKISTVEDLLARAAAQPRFRTTLIGLFALVALILACVGIYGVISYSVTQRTHEIGIRMALGAETGDILKMVVLEGLGVALIGTVSGIAASFALTRVMKTLLFSVSPTDPATFASVAFLLIGLALIASYLPARRATRVDPLAALRYE